MPSPRAKPKGSVPPFQRIKKYVLSQIESGRWKEGELIPSEQALAAEFGVSRMTANRALRELTVEQVLERVQGSGTFVAQQKYQSTLVVIRGIAEEIAARGHVHSAMLHKLERIKANDMLAAEFDLAAGKPLFHSVVVHFEGNQPIQVEDRFVNPALAPDYMQLDFTSVTANEYLTKVAPLSAVSYRIQALLPAADVASMLHVAPQQPCLVLHRKTLSRRQVASVATLWHPGNRYQFVGGF